LYEISELPKRESMEESMKYLKWIVLFFWYVLYAELALTYYERVLGKQLQPIPLARAILGLILLTAFFVALHLAIWTVLKRDDAYLTEALPPSPRAYPSEVTIRVGVWLITFTGLLILGLFLSLTSIGWPDWILKWSEKAPDFTNALATMFGAGIGSSLATIMAYLEHASDKKDFDVAYVPWYIARPLMGMLLGLIFYFLLREGLLAVVANNSTPESLSEAGLVGVGSLVGLFSKEAIEKLRELFNTLFSTRKNMEESLLERMPPELKEQVQAYLGNARKPDPPKSIASSISTADKPSG
jgi:hypothetical protein